MNSSQKKPKIIRVVTSADAVNFHLKNTLSFVSEDFETIVIGDDVEALSSRYPGVIFKNLKIHRKISIFSDLAALFSLVRIVATEKPDILHSIMPKSGLITALAGFITNTPVRIHTFTGQTWANKTGAKRNILIFFDWLVTSLNTICYSDSRSQSEFLFKNHIKFRGKPLPNLGKGSLSGVDFEKFDPLKIIPDRSAIRKQLGVAESEVLLLFLGRKHREKGIFDLIESFTLLGQKFQSARLLLVGPDETSGELDAVLKMQSSKIINLPLTQTPEIFLNACDIFCLPSHREGFGTVIIEAAALGKPAIGSEIPGLVDSIVAGKTGLLAPVGHTSDFADAMISLCANPELRVQLGKSAYQHARDNFDSKRMYLELSASYKALMSGVLPK